MWYFSDYIKRDVRVEVLTAIKRCLANIIFVRVDLV
jgi:hypothetical protein